MYTSILWVKGGYHAWQRREPSVRQVADAELSEKIRTIHAQSRGTNGAPRVHAELAAEGCWWAASASLA